MSALQSYLNEETPQIPLQLLTYSNHTRRCWRPIRTSTSYRCPSRRLGRLARHGHHIIASLPQSFLKAKQLLAFASSSRSLPSFPGPGFIFDISAHLVRRFLSYSHVNCVGHSPKAEFLTHIYSRGVPSVLVIDSRTVRSSMYR
jgi:hypothetical protein